MAEYIDKEKLIEKLKDDINRCYMLGIGAVGPISDLIDTVNEQPIVELKESETGIFDKKVLKSLEIDLEKKIFKVNGEDFGKKCCEYDIFITHKNDEISVRFNRHGSIVFENIYNANTGELKNARSKNNGNDKKV